MRKFIYILLIIICGAGIFLTGYKYHASKTAGQYEAIANEVTKYTNSINGGAYEQAYNQASKKLRDAQSLKEFTEASKDLTGSNLEISEPVVLIGQGSATSTQLITNNSDDDKVDMKIYKLILEQEDGKYKVVVAELN